MNLHTAGRAVFSRLPSQVQWMVKVVGGHLHRPRYGWSGDYHSWQDARIASSGYDRAVILERVKGALLKVKRGEAVYERDSVLFDSVEYSWPLLAGLMWIAAQRRGRLSVLDVGGSLGSTYFQNRAFLPSLNQVRWSIVEQPHFVACGKKYFANEELRFYDTIADCRAAEHPDVILLSSVLQYLEQPYRVLQELVDCHVPYMIVDLTPVSNEGRDRITVQRVPPQIYEASYPCWIFDEHHLRGAVVGDYRLVSDFDCALVQQIDLGRGLSARYRGYIFTSVPGALGGRGLHEVRQ